MLAISQKPDRVSNILRSSTRRSAGDIGIAGGAARPRRCAPRSVTASMVGGGHAAAPSRWVSAVSSRNISSRPAPSAARSSVRATPAASATWPTTSGSASTRSASVSVGRAPGRPATSAAGQGGDVAGADERAGGGEQLGLGALGDDPAVADHDQVVGDDLDLVQQVRGEQHGAAVVGVPAEQVAHPADAGRVEAVGRLVEDQHLGVADQRGRDAEPLAHAERVVAHPAAGLGRGQADQVEHLVDPGGRQAHGALRDGEDLAAGAAGVLGRGVEQDADLEARVGQVGVRAGR